MQVHPQDDEKFFSRHFCWNEAKNVAEFGEVHPADEIKRYLVAIYDVSTHVREGDD